MTLQEEADALNSQLAGKTVAMIHRHRDGELLVEFADGTRFFVDHKADGLEFSITGQN